MEWARNDELFIQERWKLPGAKATAALYFMKPSPC
jgi:hypothetical protein